MSAMPERRVFEGEVHDFRDQGGRMWLRPDGSKRSVVLPTAFVKDLGGCRVRVTIETLDEPAGGERR